MNTPKKLLLSSFVALGTVQCSGNEVTDEEISDTSSNFRDNTEQILAEQSIYFDSQIERANLADKVPEYIEGFPESGRLAKESLQISRRSFQKFIEQKQAEAKKLLLAKSKTPGFDAGFELGEYVNRIENPIYRYNFDGNSVSVQFFKTNDDGAFRDYLFNRIVIGDIGFQIPLRLSVGGQDPLLDKKAIITLDGVNNYTFDIYSYRNDDGSNGSSLSVGFGLGDEVPKTMEVLNHVVAVPNNIYNFKVNSGDSISYTNQFDENSYTNNDSPSFEIPDHLKPVDRLF